MTQDRDANITEPGTSKSLAEKILAVIEKGPHGAPDVFERLAYEVFDFQYRNNVPYRQYCESKNVGPDKINDWSEIPAYPTSAFKSEVVASFPMEQAVMAQQTSGTTSPNQRGRIFRDEVGRRLVFAANRSMTAGWLFPDFEDERRCRLLIMAPSPQLAPSMGMAIGMEQTRINFGTNDSCFLVGRGGVNVRKLNKALRQAEETGVPVAMIGATSAFIYYFNACRKNGASYRLPPGSRIADGGGYRGRFGEVTRDDYYEMAEEIFGVGSDYCINVLGMAESATNYFDSSIYDKICNRPSPRRKIPPPWTRTAAVSIEDLTPLPPGETGLLRHYDLANLPTVIGVQSDNLGVVNEDGSFEILGRAKVEDGKVSEVPGEKTVGPMGDNRIFRLLESYVNFTISFKAGRFLAKQSKAENRKAENEGELPSCPVAVDDMVASPDDPESKKRSEQSIRQFQNKKS